MTSTTEANVARTSTLGMLAVAQHMVDHHLPAPLSINRPTLGERDVPVLVYCADLDTWVATLHVDRSTDEPCHARGKVRRVVHGRLDNGVRIVITSVVPALVEPAYLPDDRDIVEPLGPQARALAKLHTGEVS